MNNVEAVEHGLTLLFKKKKAEAFLYFGRLHGEQSVRKYFTAIYKVETGKYKEAIEQLESMLLNHEVTGFGDYYYLLAKSYNNEGDKENAEKYRQLFENSKSFLFKHKKI